MAPLQRKVATFRQISTQSSRLQLALFEKSTAISDVIFGKYAALASRHPWKLFALGHVVALVFTLGFMLAEKSTDINDLWIDTDSRVVDEKKDFDHKFGGNGRDIATALQARGTGGVATATALRAHQSSVEGLFKARITDRGHNFTEQDFCEKPPVPKMFMPGQPATEVYVRLSQCLAESNVFASVIWPIFLQGFELSSREFEALPSGWGVRNFPCTRVSVLDCFEEGGEVDYPDGLKTLERVAPAIGFAKATRLSTLIQQLLDGDQMRTDLEAMRGVYGDWAFRDEVQRCTWQSIASFFGQNETALHLLVQDALTGVTLSVEDQQLANNAAELNEVVPTLVDLFAGMGYWWRPSYKNMTSQEILKVFQSANESESNPNITLGKCINGRPQGRYCCLTWEGTKSGMHFFLGDVDKFPNKTYKLVRAHQTAITNYNSHSRVWKDLLEVKVSGAYSKKELDDLAARFELEVMDNQWRPQYEQKQGTGFAQNETYENYKIAFISHRSFADLLDEGTELDTRLLLISYFSMFAFICVTLGKLPKSRNFQELIHSHILLGIYGLITVALATAAGLGFSAYVQLKFTPITSNLAPFVSLGLGVDDMFVLVQSMTHLFKASDSIEVNMVRCLQLAGPSVFLTSAANTVAFFIMSTTPTRVIFLFGVTAAINVIFNFLLLHLIFVPAIVFNTKRMITNRLDIVLVKVTPAPEVALKKNRYDTENETRFCGEHQTFGDYVATAIGNSLKLKLAKLCVVVIFTAFTAVMIWSGVDRTTEGLKQSDVAIEGTYQHDTAVLFDSNFPFEGVELIATSSNFNDEKTQQAYLDCLNSISKSPWLMAGLPPKDLAWYADSASSLLGSYAALANHPNITANTPLPADEFKSARLAWLSQLGITQLPNLACVNVSDRQMWVSCQSPSSHLYSTKVGIYFDNLYTIGDYRSVLRSSRSLVDPYKRDGLDVYLTGGMFYFYEQYLHMSDNALRTTGFTLLGVFFITFVFQFSPVLSSLVCLIVAAVVVQLWGMYTYIGIKLNPFSVANLAISVGMAVEFTAHISRAFAIAKGSHDERMGTALKEMMVPMYQGATSTIVAMAALADASSPFFRTYYCYTYIIMIVIAVVNGLIVLPVLLSLVGPDPFEETGELPGRGMEINVLSPPDDWKGANGVAESGKDANNMSSPFMCVCKTTTI